MNDYIIKKNCLFYVRSEYSYSWSHKEVCLSLEDLKLHTLDNVDVNDIDEDITEVLIGNKIQSVFLNEIREIKNV
tara:strand:- start:456 stop:680 length:225 start_codon:yes stop_codon:yes gene_type:complete